MYLYGKESELGDIISSEWFVSLSIKLIPDIEKLVGVLIEGTTDEPIVIIDPGKPSDIIHTLFLIKKLRKGLDVYVLSKRKNETEFVVEAFRAGVNDIFFYENIKDVNIPLRTIYLGTKKKISKSVAFLGIGTGGTVIVVNVAHAIKRLIGDISLCVVDCDYYKNDLVLRMGPDDAGNLMTLQDLEGEINNGGSFDFISLLNANIVSGIAVIPATERGVYAPQFGEEEYLKLLSFISMQNDITILNAGQGVNESFKSIITFSDFIYIVTTQEMIPLKTTVNLLNLIKKMNRDNITEIIVNRYQRQKELPLISTLESIFDKKINFTVPNDYDAVMRSEYEKRPVSAGENITFVKNIGAIAENIIRKTVRG